MEGEVRKLEGVEELEDVSRDYGLALQISNSMAYDC
jgi:hypothetical protein